MDKKFWIDDEEKVAAALEEIEKIKKRKPFSAFDVQAISEIIGFQLIDQDKVKKYKEEENKRIEYNRKILNDRISLTGEDTLTAMENVRHLFIKRND